MLNRRKPSFASLRTGWILRALTFVNESVTLYLPLVSAMYKTTKRGFYPILKILSGNFYIIRILCKRIFDIEFCWNFLYTGFSLNILFFPSNVVIFASYSLSYPLAVRRRLREMPLKDSTNGLGQNLWYFCNPIYRI